MSPTGEHEVDSGQEPAVPGEDLEHLAAAEVDAAYRWAAAAAADRDVLVVGCGRGHGAQILLEAGAKSVVGVDSNPRSVEIATRLYGDRIAFLTAEALALPLAAASFEAVVCLDSPEATLDPAAAITELGRVLAEDGLLLVSLPLEGSPPGGSAAGGAEGEDLRRLLSSRFENLRIFRRRLSIAATVAPDDTTGELTIEQANLLPGSDGEDRTLLAAASNSSLPDFSSLASFVGFRDLRAHQETLAAWEERARMAEADGSAKHWELVASREAQRRLRVRLHALEHRPLRVISRVLRGKPAKLGEGPPLRVSETKLQTWD